MTPRSTSWTTTRPRSASPGTTDGNEAGPVAGVFTVTQTAESSTDTVVSYTVTGTAASGIDFTALSGSVTIAAGSHVGNDQRADDRRRDRRGDRNGRDHADRHHRRSPRSRSIRLTTSDSIDILDNDSATVSIAGTTDGNERVRLTACSRSRRRPKVPPTR